MAYRCFIETWPIRIPSVRTTQAKSPCKGGTVMVARPRGDAPNARAISTKPPSLPSIQPLAELSARGRQDKSPSKADPRGSRLCLKRSSSRATFARFRLWDARGIVPAVHCGFIRMAKKTRDRRAGGGLQATSFASTSVVKAPWPSSRPLTRRADSPRPTYQSGCLRRCRR